jgi:ribonuclease R
VLSPPANKRGAIDFETTETMMMFDEGGKIERIVAPTVRNDAHRLLRKRTLASQRLCGQLSGSNEHAISIVSMSAERSRNRFALRALKDFGLQMMVAKNQNPITV